MAPTPVEKIRKILIIKPSAFGDIVHTLPVLAALKKKFPDACIHWVVSRGLHTFLEDHPFIDRLWIFDRQRWKEPGRMLRSALEVFRFWQGLRQEKFDVSIDLSGLLRSGLITWAAGAKIRLGFENSDEGSAFFYNRKIHGDMSIHAVKRYLALAACLGCDPNEVKYPFAAYDENPPIMSEMPAEYAVMVPSAGKEANRWQAERFGELASRFPFRTVLLGGKGDSGVIEKTVEHSGGMAVSLAGRTTLKELIPVIGKAKFMVTNDTGPMHVAAALGVPVFAIFGPANPIRTGPFGDIHTIITKDMDCAPCYAWKPCENWRCMEGITIDEVYESIRKKDLV